MPSTLILPDHFVKQLLKLPENGMGYQLVKVFLSNGKILRRHKVVNGSLLVLEANKSVSAVQIEKIELE